MRNYLNSALENLRDMEMHTKKWINENYHHAFWGNALPSFDTIDDLCFDRVLDGTEPENFQEGNTLFNGEETKAVMKVVVAIEKVCEEIGIEKPDTEYINSPLWDEVVSSSQEAYDLLVNNNKKYGLDFGELEKKSD